MMIGKKAAAGGRGPPLPPPTSLPSPSPSPFPFRQQQAHEEEEEEEFEAALSMSDQRTLYLVNIFIGNTVRFLNSFAALCDDKFAALHRRLLRLDATLTLLEAKLKDTSGDQDFHHISELEASGSLSENNMKPDAT